MAGPLRLAIEITADASRYRSALAGALPELARLGQGGRRTAAELARIETAVRQVATAASSHAIDAFRAQQASAAAQAAVLSRSLADLQTRLRAGQISAREAAAAAQTLRQEYGGAAQAARQTGTAAAAAGQQMAGLKGLMAGLGMGLLARQVVQAGVSFDGLQRTMKAVFGTSAATAKEWQFVRSEAYRLGLNLETTGRAYAKLSAAARGTSLEGQQTRDVFSAVSETVSVLGLSADDTNGTFTALEQMISKGVVSSEELKQQLGERLPGAFAVTAAALEKTNPAFTKLLETGQLTADVVLPALAKSLHNLYGDDAKDAANSARAQIENLKNAIWEAEVAVANSGFLDGVTKGATKLREELEKPEAKEALKEIGHAIGEVIVYLTQHGEELKVLAEAYLAWKVTVGLAAGVVQIYTGATIASTAALAAYRSAVIVATAAQAALNAAIMANPVGAGIALAATAAVAIWSYTRATRDATDATQAQTEAAGAAAQATGEQTDATKKAATEEREQAKAVAATAVAMAHMADVSRAIRLAVPTKSIETVRGSLLDLRTGLKEAAQTTTAYAGAVKVLKDDLASGKISQDEYGRALEDVADKLKVNKLTDHLKDLVQERELLALSTREREIAKTVLDADAKARSANIVLTREQRQAVAQLAAEQQRAAEAAAARQKREEEYRDFVRGVDDDLREMTLSRTEWELYQTAARAGRLRDQAQGNAEDLARIDAWYAARKRQILGETGQAEQGAADATRQRLADVADAHRQAVAEQERSAQRERDLAERQQRLARDTAEDALSLARVEADARRRARDQAADEAREQAEILNQVTEARAQAAERERDIAQRLAEVRRRAADDARRRAAEQIQAARDLAQAEAEYAARIRDLYRDRNAEQVSAAEKIREIRRRGMDDAGREADIAADSAERMALARSALAQGDVEAARRQGEAAQALAERLEGEQQAIALIQESATLLDQVKQREIRAGVQNADQTLADARIAAAEREKQLVQEGAQARREADRAERESLQALAQVRADAATQRQTALVRWVALQQAAIERDKQEALVRREIDDRKAAAQVALAAGDTEEAKRQGEKIKSLGDQLTKENEIIGAIQSGQGIITAARDAEIGKAKEAAAEQAKVTEGWKAQVTETKAAADEVARLKEGHEKAAKAAEEAKPKQTAALAAIEQAAADATAKAKKLEEAYTTGADAAGKASGRTTAALDRIISRVDAVTAHAREAAAALDELGAGEARAARAVAEEATRKREAKAYNLTPLALGGVMTSAGPLSLRRYAAGGIADRPQLALYGEGRTPEAYVPLPDGRTIPVTLNLPDGAGRGGDIHNYTITLNVTGPVEPAKLLDGIMVEVERRSARGQTTLAVNRGSR